MDEHIAAHRLAAGRRLHKNAREALDIIVRHSVVVPGVCWLATDILAKKLTTCERTIRNIFARLEELRIGQRKVIEWNGVELRFFVLNPFILPEVCIEVSANLSTDESDENADVPTDEAALSDVEAIETPEAKETNKDDDNLDTVFHRIAGEEKLPDAERQTVLERIKKYVASVGNTVAYVKSAIRRAVIGCRRAYNAPRKRSTGNVSSEPYTDTRSAFQQAINADIAAKKQRAIKVSKSDVLPEWAIKQRQEQQKRDRQDAEKASQMTEEEYAKQRARVAELLRQMGEKEN